MFCARCPYCSVLHYLSLSYTHSHTDCFRLTGENIHRQCEKWSGTDGIRMIETTYNGSHNFPIFLPDRPSFADCFSPPPPLRPCSRVPAQLHPSPGCIVPVSSMPSRLTGLAKAAQAHWKPRGATQSQPRGEREEGGVQGGEDIGRKGGGEGFWCFFFPPPTNGKPCSHFSAGIFSPSHIFLKIPEDLHQITFWIIASHAKMSNP